MRDINRTVEISVVDEENNVIDSLPRNEALDKAAHHRTIHIIATLDGNLVLQRLSQKHIKSPNLIGSSAAGFLLKDESSDSAAKRIIKKELGIVIEGLMSIKTIMLMEGRARKFVSIYWINLTELPKQIPSEFSHLLQLRVEEVETLLLNTSSNFAKTFQPVFEAWSEYVKNFQNEMIVVNDSSENDCDALQDAYKVAVEEYRFQVNLTWDRNRFFLMSGMTGISVAIAMMKFSDHIIAAILIPLFFALSSCLALLGLSAQKVGKLYYRRTLNHLFDVISLLNTERVKRNSNFVPISAFTTTKGMKARGNSTDDIDTSSKINSGSFSMYLRRFFMLIAGTGLIGMVSSSIYYIVHYKVLEKIEKLVTCITIP